VAVRVDETRDNHLSRGVKPRGIRRDRHLSPRACRANATVLNDYYRVFDRRTGESIN
jgi:hypothetical protein